MFSIPCTFDDRGDRAALVALIDGVLLEGEEATGGCVILRFPAASADAARASANKLRQGLKLDDERMRIGPAVPC